MAKKRLAYLGRQAIRERRCRVDIDGLLLSVQLKRWVVPKTAAARQHVQGPKPNAALARHQAPL
jgi:hypothetical protein